MLCRRRGWTHSSSWGNFLQSIQQDQSVVASGHVCCTGAASVPEIPARPTNWSTRLEKSWDTTCIHWTVRDRRFLDKLLSIMDNPSHPLCDTGGTGELFSKRLLQLYSHKDRFRKSFLPSTITLYHNSPMCERWQRTSTWLKWTTKT